MSAPRRWLLLGALMLLAAACDRSEPAEPESQPQAPAAAAPLPSDPVAIFVQNCSHCHQMAELSGATAESIEAATRTVASMSRLRDRLSAEQRQALATLIAEETAPSQAPQGEERGASPPAPEPSPTPESATGPSAD